MCGHTEILHQNNKRFFLDNIKKWLYLQLLSRKQSFYLKKLIPIEDIERLLVKAIALFFIYLSQIINITMSDKF